jgi:sortase A
VKNARSHWPYAAVLITAAFLSAGLAIRALWIPAKAELAQWLLARSWQQVLAGNEEARPWPWADTRPAGLLSAPRLSVSQFILEGNSGRNLAFGPVLLDGASGSRDLVISGHRDTHFRFLEQLEAGDKLRIELPEGSREYEVNYLEVIDSRVRELVMEPSVSRLSLVTCYPFDATTAGGPLRYVVTALPVSATEISGAGDLLPHLADRGGVVVSAEDR